MTSRFIIKRWLSISLLGILYLTGFISNTFAQKYIEIKDKVIWVQATTTARGINRVFSKSVNNEESVSFEHLYIPGNKAEYLLDQSDKFWFSISGNYDSTMTGQSNTYHSVSFGKSKDSASKILYSIAIVSNTGSFLPIEHKYTTLNMNMFSIPYTGSFTDDYLWVSESRTAIAPDRIRLRQRDSSTTTDFYNFRDTITSPFNIRLFYGKQQFLTQLGVRNALQPNTSVQVRSDPYEANISFQFAPAMSDQVLRIYDLLGKQQLERAIPAGASGYNMPQHLLHSGTYIVQIGNQTNRFIVTR